MDFIYEDENAYSIIHFSWTLSARLAFLFFFFGLVHTLATPRAETCPRRTSEAELQSTEPCC